MTIDGLPKPTFTINDLETLRVVADPMRAQILEVLVYSPQTVRQIAEKLGLAASKLYYHVNLMEKHGLIQVVETRQVSNMLEKIYRAAATSYDIEPTLMTYTTETGKDNINTFLVGTIDATREDLLRSLQARYYELEHGAEEHPRRVILNRVVSYLSEARVEEFQQRITDLLEEFDAADEENAENNEPAYALMVAFYPSFHFPASKESEQP
ncbi:MAG: helix-turn-helix transcriptional regulator [Anaerolineales bacterium]|nr:helix-turn-helix transcriptional regulator [Anaerolineales bacterium]